MQSRRFQNALTATALLSLLAWCWSFARADGFHNAALLARSLDDWLNELSRTVPEVKEALGNAQLRAGAGPEDLKKLAAESKGKTGKKPATGGRGKISTQLTPEQQAALAGLAANDCLEILAYMDPQNILPAEFPNFPLHRCGEFRSTAKQLVRLMGANGTSAVARQVRAELLGNGKPNTPGDLTTIRSYHSDLVELLRQGVEDGELSEEDRQALEEAVAAARRGPLAQLAEDVSDVLDTASFRRKSLRELVELYTREAAGSRRKLLMLEAIREKLPAASITELEEIVGSKAMRPLRAEAQEALVNRVQQATELELVEMLEASQTEVLRARAEAALQTRKPSFAQLEPQIPGLAKLLAAKRSEAARAARAQLERGFRVAPLTRCLAWLGQQQQLDELIYAQLDVKVDRANADRRNEYLQRCLATLENRQAGEAAHRGALHVLGRLRDRSAVAPLVDLLPKLSRKLWPHAGKALEQVTGMDFGPKEGDGVAELTAARNKWKQWLELNNMP